ncbi:hypothetical protein ACI79C_20760 [Geodermatophilus sp. SYSU D00697]
MTTSRSRRLGSPLPRAGGRLDGLSGTGAWTPWGPRLEQEEAIAMPWGVVMDVPAPVEVYDAVHAEVMRRSGGAVDGLLVHLGRATPTGFQVVEVWESREQHARHDREVVQPVVVELASGGPAPSSEPTVTEFEVRGLVVPGPAVAV